MTMLTDWYFKHWKNPSDHSKGTVWTNIKDDAIKHADIPRLEEGMNLRMAGHRHHERMRGTKRVTAWADGTTFTIRSSPQTTKPLMTSVAKRWRNPPMTLKKKEARCSWSRT